MPILLQAGASFDDYLYVEYASSLLKGEWLGRFSPAVLLKTISPAAILAVNYVLGISYPVSITTGYIAAVLIFAYAMYKLIGSSRFAVILYLFLLYSPVMFHEENVQKVYRGGYIVIFTLLVFASIIGQHVSGKQGKKREFVLWTVLGCTVLPVFYYLKEDSVWILPFVCGGMLITIIQLWRDKHTWKQLKLAAVISPLLVLAGVTIGYKSLNYYYYGEYAVTDRSDTYLKKVLNDLLQVDDGMDNIREDVWLTRNMLYTAAEFSPTLDELLPFAEQRWDSWAGEGEEVLGDFFIWAFRDGAASLGVYNHSGDYVNAYYKKIHIELQKAFKSGKLKKLEGRIYISPVAKGFTWNELIDYYRKRLPIVLKDLITYNQNITTARASTGSSDNLAVMSNLTRLHFRWENTDNQYYKFDEQIVGIDESITRMYQKFGYAAFAGGGIGLVMMIVYSLLKIIRKDISEKEISILLVTLGIFASCVLVLLAITWFCSFLSERKVYDYLCAVIPLIETIEMIGFYYLFKRVLECVRRNRT